MRDRDAWRYDYADVTRKGPMAALISQDRQRSILCVEWPRSLVQLLHADLLRGTAKADAERVEAGQAIDGAALATPIWQAPPPRPTRPGLLDMQTTTSAVHDKIAARGLESFRPRILNGGKKKRRR